MICIKSTTLSLIATSMMIFKQLWITYTTEINYQIWTTESKRLWQLLIANLLLKSKCEVWILKVLCVNSNINSIISISNECMGLWYIENYEFGESWWNMSFLCIISYNNIYVLAWTNKWWEYSHTSKAWMTKTEISVNQRSLSHDWHN